MARQPTGPLLSLPLRSVYFCSPVTAPSPVRLFLSLAQNAFSNLHCCFVSCAFVLAAGCGTFVCVFRFASRLRCRACLFVYTWFSFLCCARFILALRVCWPCCIGHEMFYPLARGPAGTACVIVVTVRGCCCRREGIDHAFTKQTHHHVCRRIYPTMATAAFHHDTITSIVGVWRSDTASSAMIKYTIILSRRRNVRSFCTSRQYLITSLIYVTLPSNCSYRSSSSYCSHKVCPQPHSHRQARNGQVTARIMFATRSPPYLLKLEVLFLLPCSSSRSKPVQRRHMPSHVT